MWQGHTQLGWGFHTPLKHSHEHGQIAHISYAVPHMLFSYAATVWKRL